MRRYTFAVMAVLLVLVPWHQSLRADAARYTVENLGTVDGVVPTVTGINAAGQMSGYLDGANPRAMRYTPEGGWQPVPGVNPAFSYAWGINADGDVSGYHLNAAGQFRAFRNRVNYGFEELPAPAGATAMYAFGINGAGAVVGYIESDAGWQAYVARFGQPVTPLPSLGVNFTVACNINDAGQIVGVGVTTDWFMHAFRLDPDQPAPIDLGTFNGAAGSSSACAIDANGLVGGYAETANGSQHAFNFDSGLLNLDAPLGGLSGNTESITAGRSVGWFTVPTGSLTHAFVHTAQDGASDLNNLVDASAGWTFLKAKAVNVDGVIVGEGSYNGTPTLFRLTPLASADTAPPAITAIGANPSVITPPNEAMVPVQISVTAIDNVDPSPVCSIAGVDTHGAPSSFVSVTPPLSAAVRAAGSALYTFSVSCVDASGNAASAAVNVAVPPDTTAPVFTSLKATPSVVYPPKGQTVTVTTTATATDDSGVAPVCKLGYITGPGSAPVDFNVTGANTGTVRAVGGRTYTFHELCVDKSNNVAWSTVDVTVPPDTTAPVISSITANPSTIWPPDGALVGVVLTVAATDDVDDAPVCTLKSITASSTTADDYSITGALSAKVRAVGGRTYTLTVRCADVAGNSSFGSAAVVVPPDTTAPVIASVSATPWAVWPPNGKWFPVAVTVSATDDVDANPSCALTSITGAPDTDYVITGPLTANVRADKNADGSTRVYSLNVRCSDRAGNSSTRAATVTVTKEPPQQSSKPGSANKK